MKFSHLSAGLALLATSALVASLSAPVAASLPQNHLPPSGTDAAAMLEASPRHGEWVEVDTGAGGKVMSWLVYPERPDNAPVVVVVHEIFGMTEWIQSVADAFAAEGFIAIAPDLLSGKGPDGGGTDSIEEPRRAVGSLDSSEIKLRLDGVAEYAMSLPAATDRYGVVGYCRGGSMSFFYATQQPAADAAVVYYGGAPSAEQLASLEIPVLGLYGGDDARVNATIEATSATVAGIGGRYEVEIYDGAGHGFLRAQDNPDRGEANTAATRQAWPRTVAFFRELLER